MKKFRIPNIPPTTNKSIRFPNDVIDEIEDAIKRNGLHIFCVRGRGCACRAGKSEGGF